MGAWLGFAVVAGPFLILMVPGSMQPSVDFDAIEYHLQGPKEWYLSGRITPLHHNVYTSMPFAVEMGHLLGMLVLGDWWTGALAGQSVVMLHLPMAAAMVALAAGRLGSRRSGWVAAVVLLGTPWAYRFSIFAYVEGPLIYYHAALIWAAIRAWEAGPKSWPTWACVGVLAGGAMACKYPALISAVLPFAAMAAASAVLRRRPAHLMAVAAGAAGRGSGLGCSKNAYDHANPVYPLGYEVFGGHPWSEAREAKWSAAHGPRPIFDRRTRFERARRGRPERLAIAAVRGPGSAGVPPARVAAIGGLALGVCGLHLHDLVAPDPPARPLLDADPGALGGPRGGWVPTGRGGGPGRSSWRSSSGLAWLRRGSTTSPRWPASTSGPSPWPTSAAKSPRSPARPWPASTPCSPPDAKPLLVGQAGVFHMKHPHFVQYGF